MIVKRYRCLNCGHRFEADVLEEGEAEAKKIRTQPVRCPECKRTDLRDGW